MSAMPPIAIAVDASQRTGAMYHKPKRNTRYQAGCYPLTWAGLSPAGSHQLVAGGRGRDAHC
jgi:hypothetical protein